MCEFLIYKRGQSGDLFASTLCKYDFGRGDSLSPGGPGCDECVWGVILLCNLCLVCVCVCVVFVIIIITIFHIHTNSVCM